MEEKREHWGSSLGFILAMAGSAIGLGNIWKFPYITGINGGGAFVLVYLLCIIFIGVPIMICEMAIGRKTQKNPYGAFKSFDVKKVKSAWIMGGLIMLWGIYFMLLQQYAFGVLALILGALFIKFNYKFAGFIQVLTGVLILSYYGIIGGWAVLYGIKAFAGQLNYNSPQEASKMFGSLIGNIELMVVFQVVFIFLCALVLWRGVKNGIEKWSKILMPAMLFLLLALIVRNLFLEGAWKGVEFFLKPDFSKLTATGVLEALGHAFFSLSLGMGIIITYGSYLKKEQNLFTASFFIVLFDTLASVLAGLAIFPAVFAMGFNPAAGPSLIFEMLPAAFNLMPGNFGWLWCGTFFSMLTIAALTSGISLMEIFISYLIDEWKISRKKSVIISFIIISGLGVLSSVSVLNWEHLAGLKRGLDLLFSPEYVAGSFFDLMDKIASNWLLPISGFLVSVFVGWVWGTQRASRELRYGAKRLGDMNLWAVLSGMNLKSKRGGFTLITLWAILVRFLIPVMILIIFIHSSGILLSWLDR